MNDVTKNAGKHSSNHSFKHSWLKKTRLGLLLLSAATFGTIAPYAAFAEEQAQEQEQQDTIAIQLVQVFQTLQQNHVSGVSEQELADTAIKAMVESLHDPYTEFMTPEQFAKFFDSVEQHIVGIGIRVGKDADGFYVAQVFAGSSAEAGGLKQDDYITAVNGKSTATLTTLDQLVNSIAGPEGTDVTLTVQRGGQSLDLKLTRKSFSVPTVESKLFDGNTGYIGFSSFSDSGDEDFARALADLKAKGIRSLIVDLRDNTGGILETAENIAKLFIKEGTLIHTKDRNQQDTPVTFDGGSTVPFPVTVLVNGNSASASEVLAGALQDYKAATLLGTKTYGKGSVQNLYRLAGGAGLKVTVEEYLTPNKRPVNKVGLTPDITVEGSVPQLIAALRMSPGTDGLSLAIDKHAIQLNGARFNDVVPIVRKDQDVYVPSRVLAALVGAEVNWNGDLQAVEIKAAAKSEAFSAGSGDAINEDGTSYISLSRFAAKFPQVTWSADQTAVKIQVKKGQ